MSAEPRTARAREASPLLAALRDGVLLADGATGSLLFELSGRLSERNHVYEALNLENPDLVGQIHGAYLRAGASALKTNTFGANEPSLARLGIVGRADAINRAAVRSARQAIERFSAAEASAAPRRFVLGSIGPFFGAETIEQVYAVQLRALIEAGVDALLFETFESLERASALVRYARQIEACPPIALHLSLRQQRNDGVWNLDPLEYVAEAAAAGASLVGVNCLAPWEAEAFVRAARQAPAVQSGRVMLSAMPNAGGFERIGHRFMSRVNPEFMGRTARTLADEGARLIGGCCEVHDEHIREMAAFLKSRHAGARASVGGPAEREPVGPPRKRANGPFSDKLFAGEFVVSAEMLPPRGTDSKPLDAKAELVQQLVACGLADAVDVTDGSRGIPLMPPGDFIQAIRERSMDPELGAKLEFIPHFTARDLNLMAVQSRLIGYFTRNIHNVLFITGDPPKMSPSYPRSAAVFDLDSVRMIELAHRNLNAGVDFGGQPLGRQTQPETHFSIGTGFEPESLDPAGEMAKLERKLAAGADYVMTQPVFDWSALASLEPLRARTRILIGVMVLTSLAHAERFAQVPGVRVPKDVFDHLARFSDEADQRKLGLELAVAYAQRVRHEGWAGLYLMSPASPQSLPLVLEALQR